MSGVRKGPVTASDVARLAGVSRSAVSRTYTEGASVAPETRAKVMEAARMLGYRVNFLARSLKDQDTRLVGLIVSDMEHSMRARLVDSLSRALVERDYRPVLLPTTRGQDTSRVIDMMLHYNVSGAIVTSDASPHEIVEECARHKVPLVLVNKADMGGRVINVTHDTDAAGRMVAEALAEAGCRKVAIARQQRSSYTIDRRLEAFRDHAADLGLTITATVTGESQNYEGGRQAARDFLARRPDVDGVHCANDFLALGFLDALRFEGGLSVPRDLKVVGCDDIAEAGWSSYNLTTVRQSVPLLTEAVIEALVDCIASPDLPHAPRRVPMELVRRGTTG